MLETVRSHGRQSLPHLLDMSKNSNIQIFWGKIRSTLKKILGYEIPIDVKVLYFGALREDVLNKKNR